jgi:hypothetical protein
MLVSTGAAIFMIVSAFGFSATALILIILAGIKPVEWRLFTDRRRGCARSAVCAKSVTLVDGAFSDYSRSLSNDSVCADTSPSFPVPASWESESRMRRSIAWR